MKHLIKQRAFWLTAIAVLLIVSVAFSQHIGRFFITPTNDADPIFLVNNADGTPVLAVNTTTDGIAVTGAISTTTGLTGSPLNFNTNSITSGLSTGFWADSPSPASNDMSQGFFYTEDFVAVVLDTLDGIADVDGITGTNATISGWKAVGNAGFAIAQAAGTLGGIVTFRAVTASNNEAYWQMGQLNTETYVEFTASSGKEVWLEYNIASDDITSSAANFFVGLCDEAANASDFFNDSGADFADDDIVGFYVFEGSEDTLRFAYQTTGTAFVGVAVQAIAANTFYTLGIHFDGATTVTYYVDGVSAGTVLTSAAGFPDTEELSPMIALKNGAQDRILSVDWIKLVSER